MKMSGGHRKAGQSSQSVEGGKARSAGGWDKALQRMKSSDAKAMADLRDEG